MGNDQPTFPLGVAETGSRAAAPIWKNFMLSALRNQKVVYFKKPTGIKKVKIVKQSGLLDCEDREVNKDVYYEYFKITTVPTIFTCNEENIISSGASLPRQVSGYNRR